MTKRRSLLLTLALLSSAACGGDAQETTGGMVISSNRELGDLAESLLPDLARRSGLELREPVRLEMRTRDELVHYLEWKLDEELPEEEARNTVASYAMLGLVPDTLDLRAMLLALYTEQVAGFYEPDSTALFVMDDQPASVLQGLLVHELVHAVQDQSADLDALTDPGRGNDRGTAAQAAIEGHATLVMLEFLAEQMQGAPVDLGQIPDFASTLKPALEGMRNQFPALANAPPVIQEALLFPYLEGAGFVQSLWAGGERTAPFGDFLPASTEQILTGRLEDAPVDFDLRVEGATELHQDDLGRLELGILLDTHVGGGSGSLADGWGGDRYVLVEVAQGGTALILQIVWDDEQARDRFVEAMDGALGSFPRAAGLQANEVLGRPGSVLTVGDLGGATHRVVASTPTG
jgi:hypothetical protein